jgi:hypothetical protein
MWIFALQVKPSIRLTLRPVGEALGMRYGHSRKYNRKYCWHGPHTTVNSLQLAGSDKM